MAATDVDDLEAARLMLQSRLDSTKTQTERNRLGQFATPSALAADVLAYAKNLLPPHLTIRFLDPAFGTGAFYSALLRTFPASYIAEAVGYEIDPHYGEQASRLWSGTPLKLIIADFTQATPPTAEKDKANLLICNPPYVRHHHLPSSEKRRLQRVTEQVARVRLGGLAGLYCYFLCLAHAWMAEDGLAGWLIPSEFMDVNYGQPVKHYLLTRVTLLRIHRFDPKDVQFGDALVSSAVVWFRKASPPSEHTVEFTYGGTLAAPRISRHIPVEMLHEAGKWTKFPQAYDEAGHDGRKPKLSDFFRIKRGVATGANEFFVLTPEQIAAHQLPAACLTPVLPSPRYVPMDEIEADSAGHPLLERKLFLLTCNLPEDEIRTRYPSLWRYLQQGVAGGIDQRYLCRHRFPWYAQEYRPPSLFLCTYMGRQDARNGKPFRFLLNHSKATAANVYLILYPKPALAKALHDKPELVKAVWQALNAITPETLVGEGRVYGGGLHKLEPNELANAPADDIAALLPGSDSTHAQQMTLFDVMGG
jgi:adenine-specific DNA-methyltransferase